MSGTDSPAGPNRVSQDWFKAHRGQQIVIVLGSDRWEGELLRWDLYNVLIMEPTWHEALVKQAPGMTFRCADKEALSE